jgi:hypothetical protein
VKVGIKDDVRESSGPRRSRSSLVAFMSALAIFDKSESWLSLIPVSKWSSALNCALERFASTTSELAPYCLVVSSIHNLARPGFICLTT